MYLILTASSDTYITNKIIDNQFRATDANVGRAGTLDVFKLYNESKISGSSKPAELSRLLLKFDLSKLHELTSSNIDINASNFEAKLKLYDILGGQATPSNFKLVVYPLSRSFDEGIGRDVASFSDLDACNFITSSYSNGTSNLWHMTGAYAGGQLNSTDIDYISSGTLGSTLHDFGSVQTFPKGNEDLNINVTTILSATLAGQLPDRGLRISFSGSEETDSKTRFVKRFASRHSSNPFKVPQLHVSWDDSVVDHHGDFVFDLSGSVFLNNYHRGTSANILSGAASSQVTGQNCVILKLQKGDWKKFITGSQHTAGTDSTGVTGLYSASFAVSLSSTQKVNRQTQKLSDLVRVSGSIKFDEYWLSTDETVGYHTGSLEIIPAQRSSYSADPASLMFTFTNISDEYHVDDVIKLKVFIDDTAAKEKVYKTPYSKKSKVLSNLYYRVRNPDLGIVVVPFKKNNAGTRLSSDSSGMYFEFRVQNLPAGHVYVFDLLTTDYDSNRVYEDVSSRFKVIS